TVLVNVQGDEPLLDPKYVRLVAEALASRRDAGIATLATPIAEPRDVFDPNVVKVVVTESGLAAYFSRAPIPWHRAAFSRVFEPPGELPVDGAFLRHIGLYAYRVSTLARLGATPPVALETA